MKRANDSIAAFAPLKARPNPADLTYTLESVRTLSAYFCVTPLIFCVRPSLTSAVGRHVYPSRARVIPLPRPALLDLIPHYVYTTSSFASAAVKQLVVIHVLFTPFNKPNLRP